jgi:hypothetical protein
MPGNGDEGWKMEENQRSNIPHDIRGIDIEKWSIRYMPI